MLLLVAKKKLNTYLLALINHINWNVSIYLQLLRKSFKKADVGLRRTCAYYRTFARAMCVRKCVRKGFGTVRAEVRAHGHLTKCDLRSHFFTCTYIKDATFNLFLHTYILSILQDLSPLMSRCCRYISTVQFTMYYI